MFKLYLQNMLWLYWNNKTIAFRSLLIYAYLGGLMGLPGAEDLKGIIKAVAWHFFNKLFDIEEEARKFVVELPQGVAGDCRSDASRHEQEGVRRSVDLAEPLGASPPKVPGAGEIDMSRAISMGRINPIDVGQMFGPMASKDPEKAALRATQQAAGAAFGTVFNIYKFMSGGPYGWNDRKQYEYIMPRGLASLSKSYRAFETGQERDAQGNTIIKYDHTDPWQVVEMLGLAMGFQPARLTQSGIGRLRRWKRRPIGRYGTISFWGTSGEVAEHQTLIGLRRILTPLIRKCKVRPLLRRPLRRRPLISRSRPGLGRRMRGRAGRPSLRAIFRSFGTSNVSTRTRAISTLGRHARRLRRSGELYAPLAELRCDLNDARRIPLRSASSKSRMVIRFITQRQS